MVYIIILYLNAKVSNWLLHLYSKAYRDMSETHRRTAVMYILNIIHTTVVLVLQLVAAPSLAEKYTVSRTDMIRVAATIVSLLYLFEIIYRHYMRLQMLIHHFAVSRLLALHASQGLTYSMSATTDALCYLLSSRGSRQNKQS